MKNEPFGIPTDEPTKAEKILAVVALYLVLAILIWGCSR